MPLTLPRGQHGRVLPQRRVQSGDSDLRGPVSAQSKARLEEVPGTHDAGGRQPILCFKLAHESCRLDAIHSRHLYVTCSRDKSARQQQGRQLVSLSLEISASHHTRLGRNRRKSATAASPSFASIKATPLDRRYVQ